MSDSLFEVVTEGKNKVVNTVSDYLSTLAEDRREMISAVRSVILQNLPEGYEEGIQYKMIGYYVPHTVYPAGYHCDSKEPLPFIALAATKSGMSLYAFCLYLDEKTTQKVIEGFSEAGKKLDKGKGCLRFKRLSDIPLNVIGEMVASMPVDVFIAGYEQQIPRKKK